MDEDWCLMMAQRSWIEGISARSSKHWEDAREKACLWKLPFHATCLLNWCSSSSSSIFMACLLLLLAVSALHVWSSVVASGPRSFISIDCGAEASSTYHNPDTGLVFEDDSSYVSTGLAASVMSDVNVTQDLRTLRYFPAATTPTKNCYVVPVKNQTQYLVRAWFLFGSYAAAPASGSIRFQLGLGSSVWADVSLDVSESGAIHTEEAIVYTAKRVVEICLIRTEEGSDPFISSLELRPLNPASYILADSQPLPDRSTIFFSLLLRANFGELVTAFRYPHDPYDRMWLPYPKSQGWQSVFAPDYAAAIPPAYSYAMAPNEPPGVVMQSAFTSSAPLHFSFTVRPLIAPRVYAQFMFAEVNYSLAAGTSRVIDFTPSFAPPLPPATSYVINVTEVAPPMSAYGFGHPLAQLKPADAFLTIQLTRNRLSDYDPIINACEVYQVRDVSPSSRAGDVNALKSLKSAIGFSEWAGDPCFPVPWDEVNCTLDQVTSLDLSGKQLHGPIPSSIGHLQALTTLNLSDNHFSGPLPTWLTQISSLQILDVTNNNLSGTFPATYLASIPVFRYSGNLELECVPAGGAVCPAGMTFPAAPPSSASSPAGRATKTSIAPIVGGGASGIVVIAGLLTWLCRRKLFHQISIQLKSSPSTVAAPTTPRVLSSTVGKAQPFTLDAILEATNFLEKEIGRGGFGPVYYGVCQDSQEVAVKVMSAESRQGLSDFSNEIDLLSTVHYKKLVSLVGYCQEDQELILLYEYMPGGDLGKCLHGPKAAQHPLTWRQRLQIALDAAKGLEYLHHGCSPAMIHGDVKSSNILLTDKLEAKVADFGLSQLDVVTAVKGTMGYLDPECNTTGKLTNRSDVYSFGVVMLEILVGEAAISTQEPFKQSIVDKVRAAMSRGNLEAVVDPLLKGNYRVEAVWNYAKLAMSCVLLSSTARPDMTKVVAELSQTKRIEFGQDEGWATSDTSGTTASFTSSSQNSLVQDRPWTA